jgi:hypothetical protein
MLTRCTFHKLVKDGNVLEITIEYDDFLGFAAINQVLNCELVQHKVVPLKTYDYLVKEQNRSKSNDK